MSFDKINVQDQVATIDLTDDPWLAEYIAEDEDRPTYVTVEDSQVTFPVEHSENMHQLLDGHEDNCLMQDSPNSARFIAEVMVAVRKLTAA